MNTIYNDYFSEQIYKLSAIELRYKYVKGLMNLVADQAGQPNAELTRNLLHALCLCLKYRNDEATNSLFYETYRFKHDLRRLLNKNELDQQSRNRIQELLRHVSYCSGLYKGRGTLSLSVKFIFSNFSRSNASSKSIFLQSSFICLSGFVLYSPILVCSIATTQDATYLIFESKFSQH